VNELGLKIPNPDSNSKSTTLLIPKNLWILRLNCQPRPWAVVKALVEGRLCKVARLRALSYVGDGDRRLHELAARSGRPRWGLRDQSDARHVLTVRHRLRRGRSGRQAHEALERNTTGPSERASGMISTLLFQDSRNSSRAVEILAQLGRRAGDRLLRIGTCHRSSRRPWNPWPRSVW